MKLYNTLSRSKEVFSPIEKGKVKIYSCGPTVYDYIHIGNARPVCVFDVLRRYLEYCGYEVEFVQNFTDIDDKIINKARETGENFRHISDFYIKEYKRDAEGLNVKPATAHPKATDNINEMVCFITALLEQGYAYAMPSGDVYFKVEKFSEYGKLSRQPLENLEAGARIAVDEVKEMPLDFVLWKAAKEGEPYWHVPWGNGRPGWHIECSAMVKKYLGDTIDIHCGGQDLIFPHHENEIAQSECANGKPLAHFWLHNGYINIDDKKMSKSQGNFFTVKEVVQEFGYEPIRYLMIASHYRSPINYSREVVKQSVASLERLYNCKNNLEFLLKNASEGSGKEDGILKAEFLKYKEHFIEAMEDDLNTANALSALFDLTKVINTEFGTGNMPSRNIILFAKDLFCELADVLGLLYEQKEKPLNDEIERLIEERQLARQNKDWQTADEIRDRLNKMGVTLEDTSSGVKYRTNF
jgi:cysteinyl-tRNA synthetase